jgi:site-specific DNA recombinase
VSQKKSKEGMSAVALIRASVDAEDRTTLLTQRTEIQDWADKNGVTITQWIVEDGKSGYKPGTPRPGHDEALQIIQRKQSQLLVVWKLDRLIRNVMGFAEEWAIINKAGGEFVSVVEEWADTTTAMGRLMLLIVAAFAEMESEMKRDRALPHARYRATNGLPPGGPRPYGYDRVDGSLILRPDEVSVIQSIAQALLDGNSMASQLREFQPMGTCGTPMTQVGLRKMLMSPTVAGLRKHGGEFYEGNWPAILDRETWDTLAVMFADPSRRTNYSDGKPAHLLTGILRCSDCQTNLVRKLHPRGLRYLCMGCGRSISMAVADEAVEAFLLSSIDANAWRNLSTQGKGYDPAVIEAMEEEMGILDEMRKLGELDIHEWREQRNAIRDRISAATNEEPLRLPEIADLQSGWAGLTLQDKRMVITSLLDSIILTRGDGNPTHSRERIQIDCSY